jgi:hypothetical protein
MQNYRIFFKYSRFVEVLLSLSFAQHVFTDQLGFFISLIANNSTAQRMVILLLREPPANTSDSLLNLAK